MHGRNNRMVREIETKAEKKKKKKKKSTRVFGVPFASHVARTVQPLRPRQGRGGKRGSWRLKQNTTNSAFESAKRAVTDVKTDNIIGCPYNETEPVVFS